jgi:hypothetical protein
VNDGRVRWTWNDEKKHGECEKSTRGTERGETCSEAGEQGGDGLMQRLQCEERSLSSLLGVPLDLIDVTLDPYASATTTTTFSVTSPPPRQPHKRATPDTAEPHTPASHVRVATRIHHHLDHPCLFTLGSGALPDLYLGMPALPPPTAHHLATSHTAALADASLHTPDQLPPSHASTIPLPPVYSADVLPLPPVHSIHASTGPIYHTTAGPTNHALGASSHANASAFLAARRPRLLGAECSPPLHSAIPQVLSFVGRDNLEIQCYFTPPLDREIGIGTASSSTSTLSTSTLSTSTLSTTSTTSTSTSSSLHPPSASCEDELTRPPLVVLLHGGPQGRDYFRYDEEVQRYARNGWACLQVNYRGSLDRGESFECASDGQWSHKLLRDVQDGTLVVRERVCVDVCVCVCVCVCVNVLMC